MKKLKNIFSGMALAALAFASAGQVAASGIVQRFTVQAGIGAVARSAQDRANDTVSVFDFMTPAQIADCRSTAPVIDQTASINNAINSLFKTGDAWADRIQSQGGGTVYLPPCNYLVTAVKMQRGVSLVGAGPRSTRLFTNTASTVISMRTPVEAGGNQAGFTIEKMMIDGGGQNQLTGGSRIGLAGIDAEGMHIATVRDVIIQRFAVAGIYSRGLVVDFNVERAMLIQNAIGFDHRGGNATTIRYISSEIIFSDTLGGIIEGIPVATFQSTIFEKNAGVGLRVQGVGAMTTINNCYFEDNGTSANLDLVSGEATDVNNTYFTYTANKGAGLSNIFVDAAKAVSINGNTFNGVATGNSGSIDIAGSAATPKIMARDNKYIGGFSRTNFYTNARLIGDAYNVVRGEVPGAEYQDLSGAVMAADVVAASERKWSGNGIKRWTTLAGATQMQLDATGLTIPGSQWNTAHLVLGTTHIWVDGSARLRMKFGSAPTSDTDGTIVGTQL